ncbi:sporulation histidine kinase inhibitor Sda [Bacillus dakarensis]|uniref:sporulation histidine kinase inhibitor Sda n=1 Tax=Robertmurraya dakarensis TaxID=1926278 RepID=UPI0009FBABA1|nr:sporulation histidine kinase inhibitor Sda [Bacillus dakarensis]
MEKLTDELLISTYRNAVEHQLDNAFINLLLDEIKRRSIQHHLKEKNYYQKMG